MAAEIFDFRFTISDRPGTLRGMSAERWALLSRLFFQLAHALDRAGTPLSPVPLPPACEAAIDQWVHHYAAGHPEQPFPSDPLQRLGLLGRLRAAGSAAELFSKRAVPIPPRAEDAALLVQMLVTLWHARARDEWLQGGKDETRN